MTDFSADDSILNDDNFKTAPSCSIQSIVPISSSGSIDQYKINQTIRIRERLAKLNADDLRSYFKGVRELYEELVAKKEEYEIESIVHQENLKEIYKILQQLKDKFKQISQNISEQTLEYSKCDKELQNKIEKEAPELAKKIQELRGMQRKLGYLKFSKYFTNLLDEVRRCLRKGSYQQLLENYRKLLKIPRDIPEYSIDEQCHREYSVKSASLVQFLQLELHSSLANLFARIHFPFEEPIDFNSIRSPLIQSVQILKCLKLVNMENLAAIGGENNSKHPVEEPLELVLQEFTKRFNFHFYGEKATNLPTKPEWFFTQLSYWAENNVEYFEQHIQIYLLEMYPESKQSAKDQFLQHLMRLASLKCRELLRSDAFVHDRRQLSHLIDECVLFEKEMLENYQYPEESAIHVVSELCEAKDAMECWIKLERDTLSAGVDSILADPDAYEPRYKEAADVDPYLVPNFADSFVILMQSLSERYRSIPADWRLQCRFLKLQLVIVDEFRSRIVQIGQALYNPFVKPYPQLMNALWYLTLILDDWSDSPEFVRLQFFLQQLQSGGHQSLDNSSSSTNSTINSLTRGTFDESAILYRHVWRQKVRNLCESFADSIRRKLDAYSREKWYDWEGPPRPTDITTSLEPFLRKVRELLGFLVENVSPDSILTLHHLTNHEVWTALDQCVISQTAFGYRGAAQILFDATHALIPLLNHCYGRTKGASEFDIFNEKCINVLSTLRLLALPPPTAILLKDELPRIPEHQLDQKLEQFEVIGLTKTRVIEIMEQRCDLVLLEKLIA